nr:MFS transporter [Pseudonocardia abyssalis]
MPDPAAAWSVLLEPRFVRLWFGTTASGLATWALPFVLGLAVLEGSLDAVGLGVVLATRTVGFLAAVPLAGVLADRYARRPVVLASGLAAAAATPLIALGLGTSVLLMAVAAAVAGAGQGACRPAFQALTAEVVDPDRRQTANAAITLAVRVSTLLGPTLAALFALLTSVQTVLLGIAALWLLAALLPPAGGAAPTVAGPRPGVVREFADGFVEARRHPWFGAGLAALTAVVFTGYSVTGVALPLVSRDVYGSEVVLAAAATGYTVGALLGALLVARWRPSSPGWWAMAGLGVYALAPLALLLTPHPAFVVAAYVVAGVGIEVFNVPWFTAIQREVEPRLLARVSSVDFLFSYGLAPVGLALIAPAILTFGLTPVLAVCAVVCLAAPALACLVPSTRRFARAV